MEKLPEKINKTETPIIIDVLNQDTKNKLDWAIWACPNCGCSWWECECD